MKKGFIAIVAVIVLMLSLSASAFAATTVSAPRAGYGYGCGGAGGSGLMWDANGKFLSKEAFEAKLDKAIEDGTILAEDRAFFIERYDYCVEYGGGAYGMRGGCGMGRR